MTLYSYPSISFDIECKSSTVIKLHPLNIFSIGSNNKRGLCTFNCFNIAEHYGEDLKQVPKEGIANSAVVKEWIFISYFYQVNLVPAL